MQHARTSSSPGLPWSSQLAHSPSLPHLSGTNCRCTFVPSSRLTVLKSHWSLSSSPLTAPNWYVLRHCMLSVWQVISHCVDVRPCNDLSVVLRRVRNCPRIIIEMRMVLYHIREVSVYGHIKWKMLNVITSVQNDEKLHRHCTNERRVGKWNKKVKKSECEDSTNLWWE